MAFDDNRPTVARLKTLLKNAPGLADFTDPELKDLLDDAIAYVEDELDTSFNGVARDDRFDGNTTNAMLMRVRPITSVTLLEVETPILGYIRTYTPDEVKQYRRQGFLKVFTWKLAVEQVLFNTLDYQAWGTIFPPLPQAVHIVYTYGYPQYDAAANKTLLGTRLDASTVVVDGDHRDERELKWLRTMQRAALLTAGANFVGQQAGLGAGYIQSVSFDGFSQSTSPNGMIAIAQAWSEEAGKLLGKRKRPFAMATIG